MECKTCGSGHGLMLTVPEPVQIGNGILIENTVVLKPRTCDCCGGFWENCENCEAGKRVIRWIDPSNYDYEMYQWLVENIEEIIAMNSWIEFADWKGTGKGKPLEDFMGFLSRQVSKQLRRKNIENPFPDYKKNVVSLARYARLYMVQIQYNRENISEEEARNLLRGNLSPDNDETYYDDSDLLQIKGE